MVFTANKYSDVVPFYTEGDPFSPSKDRLIENLRKEIKELKKVITCKNENLKEYKDLVVAWENSDVEFIRERTRWGHKRVQLKKQIDNLIERNENLFSSLQYEEKLTKLLKEKLKQDEQL
jgi:chromosome segregation ATPase